MSNSFKIQVKHNIELYYLITLVGFLSALFFMYVIDPLNVLGTTNKTQTIMLQHENGIHSLQIENYIIYIKYFGLIYPSE